MNKEIQAVENKINELAKAVIPKDNFESFSLLPLKERIFGIKFFAIMAKDIKIIEMCEYAEKIC